MIPDSAGYIEQKPCPPGPAQRFGNDPAKVDPDESPKQDEHQDHLGWTTHMIPGQTTVNRTPSAERG